MDICGKCMGTGIAGHPDSGATCDCNGGMTPTREEVEALAAAFRKATFSKGRTVGGICGQTIDAMMASTMHEVSALNLEQGACALETLAAENAALRERLEAAEAERDAADNALVDRYRDPKSGLFSFPSDVAAIVRRLDAAEAALTEARAREAAAWEAAARVADHYAEINYCAMGYPEDGGIAASGTADTIRREIRAAAPPDAAAALQRAKDAEWNAALEAMRKGLMIENGSPGDHTIRALRKEG